MFGKERLMLVLESVNKSIQLIQANCLLQRHRAVNDILSEELKTGVHALSIVVRPNSLWL